MKNLSLFKIFASAVMLVTALSLGGCGGGDANVQTATHGQQLIDLKAAYDKGLMTEKEYEEATEAVKDKMDD